MRVFPIAEGGHSEIAANPVVSVLAGDNPGRPGYTPLHLLCSTETNTTTTPAAQQVVRQNN